jgi:hypothetical protein
MERQNISHTLLHPVGAQLTFFFLPFIIIIIIIIYWYQRANDLAMNRHLKKALFKNRKKTFIT